MANPYDILKPFLGGKIFLSKTGKEYKINDVMVSRGSADRPYVELVDLSRSTNNREGSLLRELANFKEVSVVEEDLLPSFSGSVKKKSLLLYEIASQALSGKKLKSPKGIEYLVNQVNSSGFVDAKNITTGAKESFDLDAIGAFDVVVDSTPVDFNVS